MKLSPGKLRDLAGVLPMKPEIADWSQAKIESYLRFARLFMEVSKDKKRSGSHTFAFDENRWQAAKENKEEEYWDEFRTRVLIPKVGIAEGRWQQKMKGRIMMMTRIVGSWLKSNPFAITEEMESLIKDNDRLEWIKNTFTVKDNEVGGTLVVPDTTEMVDEEKPGEVSVSNPLVQYNQALLKMATVFNTLVKGIKVKDINEMDVKDKLKLAVPIAQALAKTFQGKAPQGNIFKTLIINKAGREDLEKAVLNYSDAQELQDD
jgi:hypothetical protein